MNSKRGYCYARAMHTSVFHVGFLLLRFWEVRIIMARFLHHDLSRSPRKFSYCVLALFWTGGLASGIWTWCFADDSIVSLMRSAVSGSVSIVSLLCVTGLPFLLSAFAVFLSSPWALWFLALGKGFVTSFVAMGTAACFGCAGWLIRLLLCFSDFVGTPLLYWYWLRCFRNCGNKPALHTILVGALLFLIGSVDYCLVAPFLADLIIL